MGKKKNYFKKGKQKQRNAHEKKNGGGQYTSINRDEMKNELFEKYYQLQKIIPDGEWDDFMRVLKEDLPQSWRFIGGKSEASILRDLVEERYVIELQEAVKNHQPIEGSEEIPPVAPINVDWYPNKMAYYLQMSRRNLRRHKCLMPLHNFLVTETELGNVSRQEIVSMIPPLLLDVQKHHKVLDMCAAPGSKTAQLVESLHASCNEYETPTGFVLANDLDSNRCYMLVKQAMRRLPSPCIAVSNNNALYFPQLTLDGKTPIKYERILCDVMCSSDGTFRKSPDLWKKWHPNQGIGLNPLQFGCAKRAVELLDIGGRLLYSTCSLNPIENEAVVARLLQSAQGALQLIDCSDKLKGLKRCPALNTWVVMEKDGNFYKDFSEVPQKQRDRLVRHLFPPEPQEIDELHLNRCWRILPHHGDTGGFFVALIEKTKEMPWLKKTDDGEPPAKRAHDDDVIDSNQGEKQPPLAPAQARRGRSRVFREEPFVFIDPSKDSTWQQIKEHYRIDDNFQCEQLLTRVAFESSHDKSMNDENKDVGDQKSEGRRRNIYWVNGNLRAIIENNSHKLRLINAGMRVFGRIDAQNKSCKFPPARLVQEGLSVVLPHMHDRVTMLDNRDDYIKLLRCEHHLAYAQHLSAPTVEIIRIMQEGSHVLTIENNDGHKLALCIWKGQVTVAPYASKEQRLHQLRLLRQSTHDLEMQLAMARKTGGRSSMLNEIGKLEECKEMKSDQGNDERENDEEMKEENKQTP